MIKNDSNSRLKEKKIDAKYIFFVQLWHELLDSRTLDTYQYKLLNTYTALCELIRDIDNRISGLHTTDSNILTSIEECKSLLESDCIIPKYNKSLSDSILRALHKPIKENYEKLTLKSHINYSLSILNELYSKWIFSELSDAIDNDDKELIIFCTKTLISQCIYDGWSTQFLYSFDNVFYNHDTTSPYTPYEIFEYRLSRTECPFLVFVNLSDLGINLQPTIKGDIQPILDSLDIEILNTESILEQNPDFDNNLRALFEGDSKKYIKLVVNSKDNYSAANLAIQELSDKINMLSFFNKINAWNIKNVSIISINTSAPIYKKISSEKLFKTYDYIDSSGFIFQNTIKILKDKSYNEIGKKFKNSFSYVNISKSSLFQQEKYMNLWIALESLSRTDMAKNIISNVKDTVPAALSIKYLFRIVRNFAEDLKRCNVDLKFKDATYDIDELSKTTLVQNLIKIFKDDVLYQQLEDKCVISELLLYRVKDIKKILCDISYGTSKINMYHNHVSWQIQRLYKIRNEIAHSASIEKVNLIILTEHLYDYLSIFTAEIVSCSSTSNFESICDVYSKIQDNYNVYEEIAKNPKKISKDESKWLNDTLFSTGIMNFI